MAPLKDELQEVLFVGGTNAVYNDCNVFEVQPPLEHLNTVKFASLNEFAKFVKAEKIRTIFCYAKIGSESEYYVSKYDVRMYGDLDEDGELEVDKYNEHVKEVDFSIPVDEGVFAVIGEFVYLYNRCPNELFVRYKLNTPFKMLDFFTGGGRLDD